MLLLALLSAAFSAEPVVEVLSGGEIDWTELRLEVTITSRQTRGAWQDRRLQEQDALDRLNHQITALAAQVRLTPELTAGDLLAADDALAERLAEGLRRWKVEETRYYSSGGVELSGSLDLRRWLQPTLAQWASAPAPPPPSQAPAAPAAAPGAPSGVVIDARGLAFSPALSPVVRTAQGAVLVRSAALTAETARLSSPVVYVSDPADPRGAARAGDAPLFARAGEIAPDGALVLDAPSALKLAAAADTPSLVARGRVVIVVEP